MSLQPQALYCVPEDTARIARAIFPEGNLVMRMYDELGMLFRDAAFADIFATERLDTRPRCCSHHDPLGNRHRDASSRAACAGHDAP